MLFELAYSKPAARESKTKPEGKTSGPMSGVSSEGITGIGV